VCWTPVRTPRWKGSRLRWSRPSRRCSLSSWATQDPACGVQARNGPGAFSSIPVVALSVVCDFC
jgi:hypothetical protein